MDRGSDRGRQGEGEGECQGEVGGHRRKRIASTGPMLWVSASSHTRPTWTQGGCSLLPPPEVRQSSGAPENVPPGRPSRSEGKGNTAQSASESISWMTSLPRPSKQTFQGLAGDLSGPGLHNQHGTSKRNQHPQARLNVTAGRPIGTSRDRGEGPLFSAPLSPGKDLLDVGTKMVHCGWSAVHGGARLLIG